MSLTVHAQTWERILGISNRNDVFQNLNISYDGGFLVLGAFNFHPNTRGWVIKTDINGNPLYDITIGGSPRSEMNFPQYIEPTSDGGFIVCGSYDGYHLNDIGISKHDACGNIEWCMTIRTENYDWGNEIKQLPDGGYILLSTGHTLESQSQNPRIHLMRLNSSGEILWVEPYATTASHPFIKYNVPYDLTVTADENYMISGYCYWYDDSVGMGNQYNVGRLKAMAILADSSRQEQWLTAYKATDTMDYSQAGWSTQNQSGNFYVGAIKRLNGGGPPMLMVLDGMGNVVGDSMPQFPNNGNKWVEGFMVNPVFMDDGRLYTNILYADSTNFFPGWFGLHELDSLGGWHNSFMHPSAHAESRIVATADNKILAGAVVGSGMNQDIILMKFNKQLEYDSLYTQPRQYDYLCPDSIVSKIVELTDCEVIVGMENIPNRKQYYDRISRIPITPAPNPASENIRFLLENTEHYRNLRLVCYDIYGRQMATVKINAGTDETGLNVSKWRGGLYMAIVYSGSIQLGKTRFVVE